LSFAEIAVAGAAVTLIGISKAGFGGGAASLATPMVALVLPAREAVGILLPLLILSDIVSVFHYRRDGVFRPLVFAAPGCVAGVMGGSFLFGVVSDTLLQQAIGGICLFFCFIQWLRTKILALEAGLKPNWLNGSIAGTCAGLTSTLAHAGGPPMAMYLLPQNLPPRTYMGTTVLFFAFLNTIKVPPYVFQGLIHSGTLKTTFFLAPFILVGTAIGLWSNRHLSASAFTKIIYALLFVSGLKLLFFPG
jgi:uncharacterized membrane protein YfcA